MEKKENWFYGGAHIELSHNIHTLANLFHEKGNWFHGGAHIEPSHNIHTLQFFMKKGNWFHGGAGIGRIMWNPCIYRLTR